MFEERSQCQGDQKELDDHQDQEAEAQAGSIGQNADQWAGDDEPQAEDQRFE